MKRTRPHSDTQAPRHADHDHDHGDHTHSGHGHVHGDPVRQAAAFRIAIAINALFVVVQFGYGIAADSTALIADAGHNLSDVLGLALALGASVLARRAPRGRYTYGLRSSSMLAALANAVLLLLASGAIAGEAVQRLLAPPPVAGLTVSLVAAAGVVVNGVSAWLFMHDRQTDLNVRGAYLHMAADTAVSAGVVVAGLAVLATGWNWIDPLVSLVIVLLIVVGTWGLLRESLGLLLSAVPRAIDAAAVTAFLHAQVGVREVHDLHIWAISTTETALTAHLVMPGGYPGDATLDAIVEALRTRYAITHSTLQVDQGTTAHACALLASA